MKQGLAGGEKGHSLGRSQGSLYGNKEELYDRLKRHAYQPGQGKKGEFVTFLSYTYSHPPFSFRQEQCKWDDKWFWRCSSVKKRIHVRRLPRVSECCIVLVTNCTTSASSKWLYHKPRKHKLYPLIKLRLFEEWEQAESVTSWMLNCLDDAYKCHMKVWLW